MDINVKHEFLRMRKELIGNVLEFLNNKEVIKLHSIKCKKISSLLLNRYLELYETGKENFFSNPRDLKFKKLLFKTNSQSMRSVDNSFTLFLSKSKQIIIAYNDDKYVCFYDILSDKIITKKETTIKHIENVRHFYDTTNGTNYIIVFSHRFSTLLLINCDKEDFPIETQIDFNKESYSCNLITINNKTYLITSKNRRDHFKVYEKNGVFFKNLLTWTDTEILYLSTWNDKINEKHYIINANYIDIKLIDFESGTLYKTFAADNNNNYYNFWSAYVTYLSKISYMVGADYRGMIRIWNLESEQLFKSINFGFKPVGIRQWNDRFIISSDEKKFNLVITDIINEQCFILTPKHKRMFGMVEKKYIPGYGECIISADEEGEFFLWC